MESTLTQLTAALADRYRLSRELGVGGMATVYLAHDIKHERDVAIKVLHPDLGAALGAERFLSEIKTTAKLQHPHILALLDSGNADGLLYYVMPLVDGETLRQRLTRERQLSIEDAIRITTEVAGALDYAHRQGVIHRDIKPENILLQDGRAVVADFGIALAMTSASGPRLTQTGFSLGTPQYMSPEQAMGERQLDARTDVYALGAVLYELLAGEPPFSGANAQSIVAKVLTERPTSLSSIRDTVPMYLDIALSRALAKLPADRFATPALFAVALQPPSNNGVATVLSRSPSVATRNQGFARHFSAAPAIWGAVALSMIVAGWAWQSRSTPYVAPVARLMLAPLPGIDAARPGASSAVAISPDGSRLAILGEDSARVTRLYVRYLDREEPVLVPGTEGAAYQFFSPDGESIAFLQDRKLRTVVIGTGTLTTIGEALTPFRSGSWNRDGNIVYSSNGSLYTVSAGGGTPELLLAPPAPTDITYRYPTWLPDNKSVVFDISGDTADGGAVIVRGDKTFARLGVVGRSFQYIDAGLLVYGRLDGSVAAVAFDASARRVTSEPESVTDRVFTSVEGRVRFAASASGTLVYYALAPDMSRDLVLVDRQGRTESLLRDKGQYGMPRFSPDGQRIAVGLGNSAASLLGDIWMFTIGSQVMTRLTSDSLSGSPEWAPDGRSIVFVRRHTDAGRELMQLYRAAVDGSDTPQPVLRRTQNVYESRITPEGRSMVFREDAGPGQRDILMATLDSPPVVTPLLTSKFDERSLTLSPDGTWLAYVSNETGTDEVYIRKLLASSGRWRVSTKGGYEPRWSRTGELFFRLGDSVYVSRVQLDAEPRIESPRTMFGGQFQSSRYEPQWDVSPDGAKFVMVRSAASAGGLRLGVLFNWAEHWRARQR